MYGCARSAGDALLLWSALIGLILQGSPLDADDGSSSAAGHAFTQRHVARLEGMLTRDGRGDKNAVAQILDEVLEIGQLADRTFGDYCENALEDYGSFMASAEQKRLLGVHELRLQAAFRERLVADLTTYLGATGIDRLRITDSEFTEKGSRIDIVGSGPGGTAEFTCYLRRDGDQWRLVDLAVDGKRISGIYRKRYGDIIRKELSLPVLEARLRDTEYIVLEDFSTTPVGSLPEGWGWRSKDNKKAKLYEVRSDGKNAYLAAQDSGASVILLKSSHWNPREFPIVTWCWRADALPPGGDERFGHTNDSAAGLYVVYSQNWIGIPRQIKYVWSTTLPVGTVDRRDKWGRPYFFVLESGAEKLGKWVFEQVDAYENYRRVYDGKPKKRTIGLAILTDANSTDSYAAAAYADIRVWSRKARDTGLIQDYCGCLGEESIE
jgi:hypothetical protein